MRDWYHLDVKIIAIPAFVPVPGTDPVRIEDTAVSLLTQQNKRVGGGLEPPFH